MLPPPAQDGVYGVDPQLAAAEQNLFEPRNPRAARFGAAALPK